MARGRPRCGAAAVERDIEDFRDCETADLHRQITRSRVTNNRRDRRWELGFKVDIPDFDGGLKAEEFIDWLSQVEEILDFKDVPDDRRVSW
ncbi:hypothetical protein QQ045_009300 [Rhodiola kirilowii]